MKQEVLDFSCCLIMKVASTGATPRSLSQRNLEEAMSRAWKEKYHGITQVSSSVFMAHFKSQEDMVAVYIKQPLVASSENLLVDWFDPSLNATSSSDYKFDNILVTVRAYGIPRNKRSINLLKNILNQVGEVSDFHVLQESNLFAKQDYIWGTAKIMVAKPLKDKALVSFEDNSSTVAYLHYEKIKRACLFCGILFHNVQDCSLRNNFISERQKRRQSSADIPTHRFGQWIINEKLIPAELINNARLGEQSSNQEGLLILQKLRDLFAQDPKGKGEMIDPYISRTTENRQKENSAGQIRSCFASDAMIHQQGNEGILSLPTTMGQHQGQKRVMEDTAQTSRGAKALTERENNIIQQPNIETSVIGDIGERMAPANLQFTSTIKNQPANLITQKDNEGVVLPLQFPEKINSSKRSAPPTEEVNQPIAKKVLATQNNQSSSQEIQMQSVMMENQGTPTILQCARRATPPYNPALSLNQNAQMINETLFGHNTAVGQNISANLGILGAAPNLPVQSDSNTHISREKRRPSGWDVQSQKGTSFYKPGANTWKRHTTATNARKNMCAQRTLASPCRSDASSSVAASYDHDPWPLHTPVVSGSQGVQDSRRGAFSSPQATGEPYQAPVMYNAGIHQGVQGNQGTQVNHAHNMEKQEIIEQAHNAPDIDAQHIEAAAPAFKAPRAP
jgi:hypothetical protein